MKGASTSRKGGAQSDARASTDPLPHLSKKGGWNIANAAPEDDDDAAWGSWRAAGWREY